MFNIEICLQLILTVTMTLSPKTWKDPNTQKTSYKSNPDSNEVAVTKLEINSSVVNKGTTNLHRVLKCALAQTEPPLQMGGLLILMILLFLYLAFLL